MTKKQNKQLNLKKVISLLLVMAGLAFLFTTKVNAKECHTVYGGGEVCENGELVLDKKVFNPETSEYWDNIDSNDYTFSPGQEVKFSLKIENISDFKVDNTRLDDKFYQIDDYLTFISASDDGDFRGEATGNMVKWTFGDMDEDESTTVYFTAKVKDASEIPVGLTCLTNTAVAYSHEDSESDSDSASFCIATESGKIVTGVTPDTGFDLGLVFGLEAIGFAGLGLIALAKAKRVARK